MILFLLSLCLFFTLCESECISDTFTKSYGIESFSSIKISNLDEADFNLAIVGDENVDEITLTLDLNMDGYPHVINLLEDSVWNVEISSNENEPTTAPPTAEPTDAVSNNSSNSSTTSSGMLTDDVYGITSTISGSSANTNAEQTLMMLFRIGLKRPGKRVLLPHWRKAGAPLTHV